MERQGGMGCGWEDTAPAPLREIVQEVRSRRPAPPNLEAMRATWAEHVATARSEVPGLHVEAGGEILHLGELSPGCRACKEGTWDCLFITMRCNLQCAFCCSPHETPLDYAGSAFGRTPAEIAANHARTHITGISFSGGEPFVEAERLGEWLAWFKAHCPDRYYWVYTNGLLAGEPQLRRLAALGLDEIRFNLAASGYDHPIVLGNLEAAAGLIGRVTVEIPAIPAHADRLLASLDGWSARGVRHLNLHELMFEPGSPAERLAGPRREVIADDGHRTAIDPRSRLLTLAVMRRVQEQALPLAVNDCSLQSKLRQVRGRRRSLAPLVQAPHERLLADEVLESYCAYRSPEDYHFLHPDELVGASRRWVGYRLMRLARTAPLAAGDPGRWLVCEAATWPLS